MSNKIKKASKAKNKKPKKSSSFGSIKKVAIPISSHNIYAYGSYSTLTSPCTTGDGTSAGYVCCSCC